MRVLINGTEYEGAPEAVVGAMWNDCFHRDTLVRLEEYIAYVAANVFRFTGFGINVDARTVEEKSHRLLEGMVAAGMAIKLESRRRS